MSTAAGAGAGAGAGGFDAIVASGLLSLPDLLAGLSRPPWPDRTGRRGHALDRPWPPPAVLVMHENQAAYPPGPDGADRRDAHLVLTNLASIAAADAVVWNSEWNRRSLAEGLRTMRLRRLDPDPPAAFAPEAIERIGRVIWPPVEDLWPAVAGGGRTAESRLDGDERPFRVAWPHRWEHDKGPDELLEVARAARQQARDGTGPAIRWVLLGERFSRIPEAMTRFRREFADDIEHDGFLDESAYRTALAGCDWVLSTARHEFFGIAVVEALLAGCLPWLPDRLSYPELLPRIAHGLSPANPPVDPAAVRTAIRAHLEPAIAVHAVARLDGVVDEITMGSGGRKDAGPPPP